MLGNRKMYIALANNTESKQYILNNGLQQGTVNSPLLFNMYICELLRAYGLNINENKRGVGFPDDIVIYITRRCLVEKNENIELRYSTSISKKDKENNYRLRTEKYW